jgi:hypothetical protein
LQSETWLHEVGIASNRLSARCGEYFSIQVQTARQAFEVGCSGNWRDFFHFNICFLRFCFLIFCLITLSVTLFVNHIIACYEC